ncbi:MmyB family DNA-binding protein [Amycolatopsis vancoresmycina DSM 44592]|uniref:MmyB family DNA-binding protein n=1 Tax=Amycolatopsis vancoresmycina DSM 44592 TaxID=1292037 RepID=R1HPZ2_9PSEU|nr:helix-turn-helix domain-containing protein [Amycolatopsis vancoresmycina]EOD65590.1 MmyB family DNA-binding protein [Amycolatopsis vancoresmycina DSM 44592]
MDRAELSGFLRSRRARLQPADVGLEPGPRRQAPGVRRTEVALLAGISIDYYVRLEQGAPRSPCSPASPSTTTSGSSRAAGRTPRSRS